MNTLPQDIRDEMARAVTGARHLRARVDYPVAVAVQLRGWRFWMRGLRPNIPQHVVRAAVRAGMRPRGVTMRLRWTLEAR